MIRKRFASSERIKFCYTGWIRVIVSFAFCSWRMNTNVGWIHAYGIILRVGNHIYPICICFVPAVQVLYLYFCNIFCQSNFSLCAGISWWERLPYRYLRSCLAQSFYVFRGSSNWADRPIYFVKFIISIIYIIVKKYHTKNTWDTFWYLKTISNWN